MLIHPIVIPFRSREGIHDRIFAYERPYYLELEINVPSVAVLPSKTPWDIWCFLNEGSSSLLYLHDSTSIRILYISNKYDRHGIFYNSVAFFFRIKMTPIIGKPFTCIWKILLNDDLFIFFSTHDPFSKKLLVSFGLNNSLIGSKIFSNWIKNLIRPFAVFNVSGEKIGTVKFATLMKAIRLLDMKKNIRTVWVLSFISEHLSRISIWFVKFRKWKNWWFIGTISSKKQKIWTTFELTLFVEFYVHK